MKKKTGVEHLTLEQALRTKDEAALRAFLDAGGNPNAKILSPVTLPISYAASCGFVEGVRILVAAGGKPTATDFRGNNALHQVVPGTSPEVIEVLLEVGIDVNCKNAQGATPLMMAAAAPFNPTRQARHLAVLDFLLEQKANPRLTDKTGSNALFYAIENRAQPAIDRLLAYTPMTSARYEGKRTALHLAAKKGWVDQIDSFRSMGVKLHATSSEGYTALHVAVLEGKAPDRAAVVARLLELGIESDARDEAGRTAQEYASDKPDVMQVFAAHGARARINAVLEQAQAGRSPCPK